MVPRGVPDGLGPDASRQVERTFLLVRVVRGSLLLLFLALALVGVLARGWPAWVALVLGLAMALQAGALVVWSRRYRRAGGRRT
jgi:amino acid transporter